MSDPSRKPEKDNGDDRSRLRLHEKGGSSRDGVADRFRRPSDSHDHHKYYEEKDDAERYFDKEDGRMRDGHREHRHSAKDERMKDRASHGSGRSSRRDDDDDKHRREKDGRRIKDDAYRDADGYRARQSAKGDNIYEKSEKGDRESSVEAGDRVKRPGHEGKYFHDHGRERSVEAGDRVKRSHDGERENRVDGRERSVDALATNKVKRSFEGKESYSLRDGRERSIEPAERAKRSHEAKDSRSYKDGRERLEDADRAKRFYEGKDSHPHRNSRERSIEAIDRSKRLHEANDSLFHRDSRERSIETVDKAKRSHEGKDSHSLRDSRERSIDAVDRAKRRTHEGKDSHLYRDSSERSMEVVHRARSSRDTRDLNPYDEEMDGRPRKRREREHDNEGRKDKSDKRTKFTEDDAKDDRKHKGDKRKFDAKMQEELTNDQADQGLAKRQAVEGGSRGSSQVKDGQQSLGASGNGSALVNVPNQSAEDMPRSENPSHDSLAKMKAAEEALEGKENDKVKPSFELSGKLAAETNKVRGIALLFNEPPDARKPTIRWRLYVFKGGEALTEPLYIHRQSCYLFGRERRVADVPTDHPSCSKQHAVIQFRQVEKEEPDGTVSKRVRPYVMDLGSTNGTHLNDNRLEPQRYYELLEKDTIKFGNSSREYVLLHENSAG